MKRDLAGATAVLEIEESSGKAGVQTGKIVRIDETGQAWVQIAGRPIGPVAARSILSDSPLDAPADPTGCSVLLAFEDQDAFRPIILGILHARLFESSGCNHPGLTGAVPASTRSDRERVVLEAKEEVVLRCGTSSVTLKAGGRVLIRGTHVVSRSSGVNAIKGASVRIN